MSLKLHSNQYPNHLQIPRIHKIAETRLIPLSTRGGEGEGSGETNVVVATKFLHERSTALNTLLLAAK